MTQTWLLVSLAVALVTVAGAEPVKSGALPALTLRNVRTRSASALAESAFREYSRKIVEVRRTHLSVGDGSHPELDSLVFATKTRSGGDPGVCQAEVLSFIVESKNAGTDPVGHPATMEIETKYLVIGPTDVPWSRALQRAEQRDCFRRHGAWDFIRAPNANVVAAAAQVVNYVRDALKSHDDPQYIEMQAVYITTIDDRLCDATLADLQTHCIWMILSKPEPDVTHLRFGNILEARIQTDFTNRTSRTRVLTFKITNDETPIHRSLGD